MLYSTVILVLLQALTGVLSYVVVEENGYYSSWRRNPMQSQINQWTYPGFMSSQFYIPFGFNPMTWWQSNESQMETNIEIDIIRDRQAVMFSILKCIINEEKNGNCKDMLEKALKMFPESEILLEKPSSQIKSSITQPEEEKEKCTQNMKTVVEPLEIINLGIDSPDLQQKLSETGQEPTKIPSSNNKPEDSVKEDKPEDSINIKEDKPKDSIKEDKLEDAMKEKEDIASEQKPMETTLNEKPQENIPDMEEKKVEDTINKVASEKPLENQLIIEEQHTVTEPSDASMSSEAPTSEKDSIENK